MNKNTKVISLADQLAALEAQRTALMSQVQDEERNRVNALAAKIDGLVKEFGVENLDAVSNLIRQRVKGTLGSLEVPTSTRTVLTKEQWDGIKARIAKGGPGNQRSEIIKEFNIHQQTLQNQLKNAGMVNSRPRTIASVAAVAPTPTADNQTAAQTAAEDVALATEALQAQGVTVAAAA